MKKFALVVAIAASVGFSAVSQADDTPRVKLTAAEIKTLISDTDWKNSGGNTGHTSADGTLYATSARGSFSKGTWSINSDDELCVEWSNTGWSGGCGAVFRVGDTDTYERSLPATGVTQTTYVKTK